MLLFTNDYQQFRTAEDKCVTEFAAALSQFQQLPTMHLIIKAMIASLYQEYEIHAKGQTSHMPKTCFTY
jgi:hypothetical protein